MALIELLLWLPDDPRMQDWWTLHHATDHTEILQAIKAQKGVDLTQYILDPYNEKDEGGWLTRHQAMHNDFNGVLQLPGADLQNIEISDEQGRKEFALQHFSEHQQARAALKI